MPQPTIVARIHSGAQINGQPASLQSWRFTSENKDLLEAIAQHYGADKTTPNALDSKGGYEVFTTASEVDILIDANDQYAVSGRFIVWPPNGQTSGSFPVCGGGQWQIDASSPRRPYMCPDGGGSFTERKAAGHICKPDCTVRFRLADNPDAGIVEFRSSAFSLAEQIAKVRGQLEGMSGMVKATLRLEQVNTSSRSFMKPVLAVVGSADEVESFELEEAA